MFQDEHSSFSSHIKYAQLIDKSVDLYSHYIEKRLKDETYEDGDPITVVDYGTCDGVNILPLFKMISEFVNRQKSQRKIKFIFNDKDQTCVPQLEQMIKEDTDFERNPNIEVTTNTGDCYDRCLPAESVDICFCMMVIHWLSSPSSISNGLFWFEANDQELQQIKRQCEEDWVSFLKQREQEMKSGGVVITNIPIDSEQSVNTLKIPAKIFRDMLTENIITKSEFEKSIIPISAHRTALDLKRPFENGIIENLRLETIAQYPLCFKDMGLTKDTISEAFKSWMYNSILNGLSQERSIDEKTEICDQFFTRIKHFFQENENETEGYGFEVCICVIQKL